MHANRILLLQGRDVIGVDFFDLACIIFIFGLFFFLFMIFFIFLYLRCLYVLGHDFFHVQLLGELDPLVELDILEHIHVEDDSLQVKNKDVREL